MLVERRDELASALLVVSAVMMRLHHFHSSSTSFRVRIALNLKGVAYEHVPVILRWKDGDHDSDAYKALNPQANVPMLEHGEVRLVQSLAILEYLDAVHPEPPLFPTDPVDRARVSSIALHVACEVQPLNNLRVERYLAGELHLVDDAMRRWRRHWIERAFDALETILARSSATGRFCHGDAITAADCCLVPQAYNAQRPVVGLDLARWPTIARIYDGCMKTPAVERALPQNQPGFSELKQH